MSKDRTIAIVDGSGVLYDPNGIDRNELLRLMKQVKLEERMVGHFDTSKLGVGGFKILITDRDVKLPSGELIESGLAFRNNFHLSPFSTADLFVPCGGRPESVNLTNVHKMFHPNGKPRFKIIVEGANMFFTQDARMQLEEAGVILYKDATANKGGVTSSSLEVLAALSMKDDEFSEHMCAKNGELPEFYQQYVMEIEKLIEDNARSEFECIWNEHQKTNTHRYILTDKVSDKINQMNDVIQESSLYKNRQLVLRVLSDFVPKCLQKLIGLEEIVKHVPDNYVKAIFGSQLASLYVYKHGLNAPEFGFFEFMQPYLTDVQSGNWQPIKRQERKVKPSTSAVPPVQNTEIDVDA